MKNPFVNIATDISNLREEDFDNAIALIQDAKDFRNSVNNVEAPDLNNYDLPDVYKEKFEAVSKSIASMHRIGFINDKANEYAAYANGEESSLNHISLDALKAFEALFKKMEKSIGSSIVAEDKTSEETCMM